MKISAIEWLLLNNGWRLEALQQSNALFRMFLSKQIAVKVFSFNFNMIYD